MAELAAPSQQEETDHARSELAAVLTSLPDEPREILLMRFVDDMSLADIATVLDIPVGTIKTKLYRALRLLHDDRRTRDYFLE